MVSACRLRSSATCVWLYYRFPLSFREVEEMMPVRGIVVSHETIRQWCAKFGQLTPPGCGSVGPRPGDKWHLDEVFITIRAGCAICGGRWTSTVRRWTSWFSLGATPRPRRILSPLVQGPALCARVVVTDKLASYGAAHREVLRSVEHRQSKYLNNRAENSHQRPANVNER